MVDDQREPGVAAGELGDVAEVIRKDCRELEDEVFLLQHRQRGRDRRLQDPVRIGLEVDQVTDPSQLGPCQELVQSRPCAGLVGERAPRDDGAHPCHVAGKFEHVVGVVVSCRALD